MANQTNININVKVDDKQVGSAVKSTENLRREIKQLEVELTKVEIGSKEFENLSERLKDNRDKLELVRAKSRDLFDSFSMLPGPIGQIGTSITSTSDKLKIFTSFNLKDIKGQFKAVGDDIKLVAGNLGKATGITKLYEATVGGLSKAFTFFGVSTKAASTAAQGFGKALIATGIGAIVVAVGSLIANFDSLKATFTNLFPSLAKMGQYIGGLIDRFTDFVGITSKAEREQKKFVGGLEQGLKKEKESWDANADKYDQFTQRKVNANLKFKEKQIEILNDETKNEKEKNALIKQYRDQANREIEGADKDRAQKSKDAAKQELDRNKQTGDQLAQQNKQRRQEEQDAVVQNLKNAADTDENALREALKKQQDIRNEGKKLTKEQEKLQADEINKIVKDELQKDKDDRQKAFDDRLKLTQEAGKLELDAIENDVEAKKIKYGEDSKEFRAAQQSKFDKQFELLTQEEKTLKEKEKTKDGLTQDEINRLKSIQNERGALTNTVNETNKEQINSDREKAAKTLENDKKAKDEMFANQMANSGMNFELQQQLLEDKLNSDREYYAAQELLYAGNKEKLDEIDRARLASQASYAQGEEEIRKKQVSLNLQAADAAINALGAQTAAGKAALIAKQFLLAKELVLEVKRTVAFSKLSLAESKVAVATGAAKTAKVGFPQNIPLLILYAAQAVSIIKTVIDATKMAGETSNLGGSADAGSVPSTGTQVPRPRGMATGGLVQGVGGPTSDLIPAMLSNGESVINANSTSMFKPVLSAINEIGGGRRFAEGGVAVGSFGQDQTLSQLQTMMNTQQVPIKTYVVASDMSNQQMLDRNIKSRSTL
jgi:hypothetical protein